MCYGLLRTHEHHVFLEKLVQELSGPKFKWRTQSKCSVRRKWRLFSIRTGDSCVSSSIIGRLLFSPSTAINQKSKNKFQMCWNTMKLHTTYEKPEIGRNKTTTIRVKNDLNAMIRKLVKTTSSTRKKRLGYPPPGNDSVRSTVKNALQFFFLFPFFVNIAF